MRVAHRGLLVDAAPMPVFQPLQAWMDSLTYSWDLSEPMEVSLRYELFTGNSLPRFDRERPLAYAGRRLAMPNEPEG
jgi:hypothetical protein